MFKKPFFLLKESLGKKGNADALQSLLPEGKSLGKKGNCFAIAKPILVAGF